MATEVVAQRKKEDLRRKAKTWVKYVMSHMCGEATIVKTITVIISLPV